MGLIIAANWKMHKTAAETAAFCSELKQREKELRGVEVLICPPFTALAAAAAALEGSGIKLGAQNMFWEVKGAFTGETVSYTHLDVYKRQGEAGGEEEPPGESLSDELPEDDFPWEEYFRDMDLDTVGYMPNPAGRDWSEFPTVDNYADSPGTMMEELLGQLRLMRLSPRHYSIAAYLIGHLDPNGYLGSDLGELAAALGITAEEMETVLQIVQGLEPTGIASRNIQELSLIHI